MNLQVRKVLGFLSRLIPCKYGSCLRCGITHCFSSFHITVVKEHTTGIGVICQPCYESLTPQDRLPFYRMFIEIYRKHGVVYDKNHIDEIERAVMSEQ
jgi:hypothetical protein